MPLSGYLALMSIQIKMKNHLSSPRVYEMDHDQSNKEDAFFATLSSPVTGVNWVDIFPV